jgi:AraC-like DNA-binding protein
LPLVVPGARFSSLGPPRGMVYLSHAPSPPLDAFVENLWCLSDSPPHARERILPSGTLELVINLHEDEFRIYDAAGRLPPRRFRGAMVSGAYRGPFVIDTEEHASVIGVHFAPGGAVALLGAPPGDLADAHLELEILWPGQASELRERLCAAQTPATRFRVLEEALMARLRHPCKQHGAVRAALEHIAQPGVTVAAMADRVGLSHRRFIELFTAEVGLPPKLFARLQRFQRAMAVVEGASSVNWAQLAIGCGYYDQSHLIRDFAEFAGASPADLLRHRSDRVKVNHVALPDGARSNLSNTTWAPQGHLSWRKGGPDEIALEHDPEAHRDRADGGRLDQRRMDDD